MSLNSFIISTLAPTGVPVAYQVYNGSQTTYITFFEINQNGSLYAEDVETKTKHSVQVDVWSKGNYTNLVEQVRTLLTNVGFSRYAEPEFYEEDTKTYHKVFRFYYENTGGI